VGDVAERSGAVNSIAAQEFGSDDTDPFDVSGGGITGSVSSLAGLQWTLTGEIDTPHRLGVHATPISGTFLPTLAADPRTNLRLALGIERPTTLSVLGTELRWRAEVRHTQSLEGECGLASTKRIAYPIRNICATSYSTLRGALNADIERPVGADRIVSRTTAAAVGGGHDAVPPQDLVFLGGPTTGPGYDFHEFAGRVGVSQRLEWQLPVPFPAIALGRFGHTPAAATLAPFVNAIYVRSYAPAIGAPLRTGGALFAPPASGVYPSAGIGLLTIFDLLRFDVARGFRGGNAGGSGRWTFSVDVNREFWSIL
jgi:hypothetical protein